MLPEPSYLVEAKNRRQECFVHVHTALFGKGRSHRTHAANKDKIGHNSSYAVIGKGRHRKPGPFTKRVGGKHCHCLYKHNLWESPYLCVYLPSIFCVPILWQQFEFYFFYLVADIKNIPQYNFRVEVGSSLSKCGHGKFYL